MKSWQLCLQTCFAIFFFQEPSFNLPSVSAFPLNDTQGRRLYFNLSLVWISVGATKTCLSLLSMETFHPETPPPPTLNKQNTPWGNYYCCWHAEKRKELITIDQNCSGRWCKSGVSRLRSTTGRKHPSSTTRSEQHICNMHTYCWRQSSLKV